MDILVQNVALMDAVTATILMSTPAVSNPLFHLTFENQTEDTSFIKHEPKFFTFLKYVGKLLYIMKTKCLASVVLAKIWQLHTA